ncbi:6-carboxytetrahydropterin synthase [Reyranella sp. CPCC 100927]|uniref:6-pyruvoyl trahydropterin synthase family protein n=1 Tax=Reyranella sp. CPCC 100927 TaxID=2599616 RepID=UPI0011B85581|nr:6-carboxytetrahydropterin synthase [Reyranella sp. CPCC 100927]TWS94277.1 6-carboxytetrahydropterin synthase [Reyranella sp. CPCC 100927]
MFAVEVRDHIMVAHSFRGEIFGPAQRMHGATFVVDAAFLTRDLDAAGLVVDIGRAITVLREVLEPLNYRNLDEMPDFAGKNTTTEFLARYIHDRIADGARAGKLGRPASEIDILRVTLSESHVARGWYEAPLG